LSELRNIDFNGVSAQDMTLEQIKVTATRFNRGPDLSNDQIKQNLSYGEIIIKKFAELYALLKD
jgi:hypothetical protein